MLDRIGIAAPLLGNLNPGILLETPSFLNQPCVERRWIALALKHRAWKLVEQRFWLLG